MRTIEPYRIRLLNRYKETIADGEGIRYSIYLAGCVHHCPGCHNPESQNPYGGVALTDDILREIVEEINDNPILDGITISGGDPFYNPIGLLALLQILKEETALNIWCYTGYTLEELQATTMMTRPLDFIDVLVDGKFIQDLFDPTLAFRGSSNQKIIDLNKLRALEHCSGASVKVQTEATHEEEVTLSVLQRKM